MTSHASRCDRFGRRGAVAVLAVAMSQCSRGRQVVALETPSGIAAADASRSDRSPPGEAGVAETAADAATREPASAGSVDYARSPSALRLPDGTVLPGPCVDPVAHAAFAVDDGGFAGSDYRRFYRPTGLALDIDGDGAPDFVLAGGGVRAQSTYHLYVRRGDCGYYVGTIPPAEDLKLRGSKSHGLRDLRSTSDECPKSHRMHYCEGTWRFDGSAYVLGAERPIERTRPPPEVDIGSGIE